MKYNPVKFNREVVKRFWQQGYRSPTEISRKTNVPLRSCERYIGQLRKNGQIRAIHRSGRPRKTLPKMRRQIGKIRNTSGNCKDSLREDPRQWVDFKLKNNLHHNSKKKAFNVTEKTKVATKTPNLTVLEFCHAIYTQNQSDLGLPEGCCPAESVLTYYINARINYHIGKEEEPHDAKLGFNNITQKNISQAIFITIVEEEWNNLSNEAILNCITSMQNRIQDCISVKGGHTKY
ncbi:hypothetical protein G9A89_017817 [Geosiphon pyriformis]|nr:hypothetical protein G9A89_017817 [Geosiphon pyriformis]